MKKLTFTALALMMCGAAWAAAIPQASRYDSACSRLSITRRTSLSLTPNPAL